MLATDPPAPAAHIRDIDYIRVAEPAPVVLAYGIGVDSTALLVELESRGTPPDLVLTGDPGIEKPETYAYQKMIAAWMAARGIRYETVRYTPRRFKHWPPYYDLLANVLTNATLPSISLGRHSCSLGPSFAGVSFGCDEGRADRRANPKSWRWSARSSSQDPLPTKETRHDPSANIHLFSMETWRLVC